MLGQGWSPGPALDDLPQEPVDYLALRLELVLEALETLRGTITTTPAPQVNVEPPDLTAIVNAVNSLKVGADPEQIAEAITRAINRTPPETPADYSAQFTELLGALRKLDVRLANASAPRMPGGLLSDVRDRPDRELGHVTVDALPAVSATDNVARVGVPVLVNSTSATPIATPSVGKALRVRWVGFATPDSNSASTVITLTLGATVIYQWPLGAPGAFAHTTVRVGAADEVLTATLSAAQPVYVNVDYEEI